MKTSVLMGSLVAILLTGSVSASPMIWSTPPSSTDASTKNMVQAKPTASGMALTVRHSPMAGGHTDLHCAHFSIKAERSTHVFVSGMKSADLRHCYADRHGAGSANDEDAQTRVSSARF